MQRSSITYENKYYAQLRNVVAGLKTIADTSLFINLQNAWISSRLLGLAFIVGFIQVYGLGSIR